MSEMLNASHKKEINEAYFHLSTAPRIFNNQLGGFTHRLKGKFKHETIPCKLSSSACRELEEYIYSFPTKNTDSDLEMLCLNCTFT